MNIPKPFILQDTPNPNRRSFWSVHDQDVFTRVAEEAMDGDQGFPIFRKTLYKNWVFNLPGYVSTDDKKLYGNYVYNLHKTTQEGVISFLWCPVLTDKERRTPFNRQWLRFGNHRWPPLLKGLNFIEDAAFPVSTNVVSGDEQGIAVANRNYVREIFVNEVNEGSSFLLEEFFSDVPYRFGRFPVPQPGSVSYQLPGVSGSFPECLHGEIEIPSFTSATATLIGDTGSGASGAILGQFFPKTNFTKRVPYVLTVDQANVNGGYHMQRIRVFPPASARNTVQ